MDDGSVRCFDFDFDFDIPRPRTLLGKALVESTMEHQKVGMRGTFEGKDRDCGSEGENLDRQWWW